MFIEKFTKRVSTIVGRDIFISIINFFITTYVVNSLGPKLFGLWVGVLSFLMICDLLFRLKIDQLIIFYSGKYPNNIYLYKQISIISLKALIIAGIIIYFLHEYIINFFDLNSAYFLLAVYLNFFISIFGNIIFYIFLSESKYNEYNFSNLFQAVINGLFIVILFQTKEASIFLPLISLMASWIAVIIFFLISRIMRPNNTKISKVKIDLKDKDILQKGIFIYASAAGRGFSDQIPRLFAINFLGPANVGFIGLAQVIVTLLNRIPVAINTVLYPMLVKEETDELGKCFMVVRVLLIIFAPIILLLGLIMPYFILFFYGENFSTSSTYIRLILPFIYIGLPGFILSSYFAAKGRFKDLFYINISAVIFSLLCLYAVSFFSLEYAPIASLNMTFLTITLSSIFVLSRERDKINLFPKVNDLRKLIIFIRSCFNKNK